MVELQDILVGVLKKKILAVVNDREAGHCIRVDDVPTEIAYETCQRLADELEPPNLAVLVRNSPDPSTQFEKSPTEVVELRNRSDSSDNAGVLVVFIPPKERLAVEDSINASTFQTLQIEDLPEEAWSFAAENLIDQFPEQGGEVEIVAKIIHSDSGKEFQIDYLNLAAFAVEVLENCKSDPDSAIFKSMGALGLLGDSKLFSKGEEGARRRMLINQQQVKTLSRPVSPVQRIMDLPIDSKDQSELVGHLLDVLKDSAADPTEITRKLQDQVGLIDLANWNGIDEGELPPDTFRIVKLIGDLDSKEDGDSVSKAQASIGVEFMCSPPPKNFPDASLRMDLMVLSQTGGAPEETGVSVTKKNKLPGKQLSSIRKKWSFGSDGSEIPPGIYRFRLKLISHEGTPLAEADSGHFRVGEMPAEIKQFSEVHNLLEAYVSAIRKSPTLPGKASVNAITDEESRVLEIVEYSFEGIEGKWRLPVPQKLAELEYEFLEQPGSVSGLWIDLGMEKPDMNIASFQYVQTNGPFIAARTELFERLSMPNPLVTGLEGGLIRSNLLLADLSQNRDAISNYVNAWTSAITQLKGEELEEVLAVDRLTVLNHGVEEFVLLSPTHPLRLAWALQFELASSNWILESTQMEWDDVKKEANDLFNSLPGVIGDELPLVLTSGRSPFRYIGAISSGWGLWEGSLGDDSENRRAILRNWLGASVEIVRSKGEEEVTSRVRAFLKSHPYVKTLILNVVKPGEAAFVLKMLGILLKETPELRFIVRLYGELTDPLFGRAFERFMADPDGGYLPLESAELLSRAGSDPLRPRVSFSKHSVDDLRTTPSHFPAHLTILLDFFKVDVSPMIVPEVGRSIYGNGLITSACSHFEMGTKDGGHPKWLMALLVKDAPQSDLEKLLKSHQEVTAKVLAGVGDSVVPVLSLELDIWTQSLLDAVHETSDWVVVIDPVFSHEYLDTSGLQDQSHSNKYVVDSSDTRSSGELRNVVVSARVKQEQSASLVEVAQRFGLQLNPEIQEELLDSLHVLGSGLGLRLLVDSTKRDEAFSLALASKFLVTQGFLRHSLIIPLDEHLGLFDEAQEIGEIKSLKRTDLMLVQFDIKRRTVGCTLVEVKVRSSLGEGGNFPQSLAEEMSKQLRNTEPVVLNRLFGAHLRQRRESFPALLTMRKLVGVLSSHLDRSIRGGFISEEEGREFQTFINDFDHGLTLSVNLRGLVFNLAGSGIDQHAVDGITIDVVGSDFVQNMLQEPEIYPTELPADGQYLHTVLGAPSQKHEVIPSEIPDGPTVGPETIDEIQNESEGEVEIISNQRKLSDGDLLGHATVTQQYAFIGSNDAMNVPAFIDVGGTNVVSVFGVQGSGKSYTVGAILEAGLIQQPGLGELPSPLAAVVFHYSSDATYKSEFSSMFESEGNPDAVERLREIGLTPEGVGEVVVLVSSRQLEIRKMEYPGLNVSPLQLSTSELTVGDWKLLMGIEGGAQMYSKVLGGILKTIGSNFSIDDLKAEIDGSQLSNAQKNIALARVEFVREHLSNDPLQTASDWLLPGRLLIIDLRDEFIEKEEALAIFMVLLNRFAEKRSIGEEPFNKMVVFDEAHKYMDSSSLTQAMTEAVREMRHKGVTLVVASQDPPSIPSVVIELSSVIVAHRMTSPNWLKTLQKSSQAFGVVQSGQLAQLKAGHSFVWSSGGAPRYRQPQKVVTRQRVTKHGGDTVRVDG